MSVVINTKFVRQRLMDMDWDQKNLAQACGMSEVQISRLMNGSGFTSKTLGVLAKALGCSPVDLIQPAGFDSPLVVAPISVGQHT